MIGATKMVERTISHVAVVRMVHLRFVPITLRLFPTVSHAVCRLRSSASARRPHPPAPALEPNPEDPSPLDPGPVDGAVPVPGERLGLGVVDGLVDGVDGDGPG